MANLTVTNGLLFCRELYVDSDTVDAALTGTQLVRIANEKYLRWHEKVERRFQTLDNTTTGLDLTGLYTDLTSIVTIAEIESVSLRNATNIDTEAERAPRSEVLASLSELSYGTASDGRPYRYFIEREGTDTEASIGLWRIYLNQQHDVAGASATLKAILRARVVPALLTVSGETSTDQMDVSDEAAYTIWRLVAAEAARIVGDDEMVPGILATVPQDVLASMGMSELATRPREAQSKRAA